MLRVQRCIPTLDVNVELFSVYVKFTTSGTNVLFYAQGRTGWNPNITGELRVIYTPVVFLLPSVIPDVFFFTVLGSTCGVDGDSRIIGTLKNATRNIPIGADNLKLWVAFKLEETRVGSEPKISKPRPVLTRIVEGKVNRGWTDTTTVLRHTRILVFPIKFRTYIHSASNRELQLIARLCIFFNCKWQF